MNTHTHTHQWLNQAFAVAEGNLANRMMVHCLVAVLIQMMIVQIFIIVHCLVPVLIATTIVKVLVPAYTSVIATSNDSIVHSTINHKCDNDSNNGANHNKLNGNNKSH